MSKKCGKELHPLYNPWYHARRKNLLCVAWKKDFWLFVKEVKERPANHRLTRLDDSKELDKDNFRWVEYLKSENYKDKAEYMRAYRKANPDLHKNIDLKKHFGITLNQYKEMKERQNGVCAICGNPETIFDSRQNKLRDLSVDHCHKTGKIRGLLCSHCNHAIGKFNDDVNLLQAAINYLTKE